MYDEDLHIRWPDKRPAITQRLSLSRSQIKKKEISKKTDSNNSSDNQCEDRINPIHDDKLPTIVHDGSSSPVFEQEIRVKNLSQLIDPQVDLIDEEVLDVKLDEKPNEELNSGSSPTASTNIPEFRIDTDIIVLSSSDEHDIEKTHKSPKKTNKNKSLSKKFRTPVKKLESDNNNTLGKSTIRRKVIRSNNLKRISAKDHAENQTRLDSFFSRTPSDSIKYFETFEMSTTNANSNIKNNQKIDDKSFVAAVKDEIIDVDSSTKSKSISKIEQNNGSILKTFTIQSTFPKYTVNLSSSQSTDSLTKYFHVKKNPDQNCEKVKNYLKENMNDMQPKDANRKSNPIENTKLKLECILQNSDKSNTMSSKFDNVERKSLVVPDKLSVVSSNPSDPEILKLKPKRMVRKKLDYQNIISSLPETTKVSPQIQSIELKRHQPYDYISNCSTSTTSLSIPKKNGEVSLIDNNTICLGTTTTNSFKYNTDQLPILIHDDDDDEINMDYLSSKKKKSSSSGRPAKKVSKNDNNLKSIPKKRKTIQCPSYKVVEGTKFAVDGFRFGMIEGVTHYFLTHFHGDHYIGLKKSFSMPVYMSDITATLVQTFINVSKEYLNVIPINDTIIIDGIEVTAIDANHCPGAVMFAFKLPNGKCILHTGDFRACPEMESEPYFWNNQIHTIYLDTTYLNKNYDFKPQTESIEDVRNYVNDFLEHHIGKKILIVCGSYVIGKEKVWAAVAEMTGFNVYVTGTRKKALKAIADDQLLKYLIDDPKEANIHVATMKEVSYLNLYEYFQEYNDYFDVVLGIRPSGWEKNSKPQLRGTVNVVGIEYSEHSSYAELRRFVRFLQPHSIISTVPTNNHDMSHTANIPRNWFNNDLGARQQSYQPTIRSFVTSTAKKQNDQQNYECQKTSNSSKYVNSHSDHNESEIGMMDATRSSHHACSLKLNKPFNGENLESAVDDDWMS